MMKSRFNSCSISSRTQEQNLFTTSNMDRQLLHQKLVKKSQLNENINTGVSVVFKTKRELKCKNKPFFWKHQIYVFITENF